MFEQSVHDEMVQLILDCILHWREEQVIPDANGWRQPRIVRIKIKKDLGRCMNAPTCHTLVARGFARDLIETTYDKPCCARSCSHVDVSHERTTRVLHVSRRPHFFVRDRNTTHSFNDGWCLALQVFSSSCHCMRDSHHASQRETEDLAICETEFVLCTRRWIGRVLLPKICDVIAHLYVFLQYYIFNAWPQAATRQLTTREALFCLQSTWFLSWYHDVKSKYAILLCSVCEREVVWRVVGFLPSPAIFHHFPSRAF